MRVQLLSVQRLYFSGTWEPRRALTLCLAATPPALSPQYSAAHVTVLTESTSGNSGREMPCCVHVRDRCLALARTRLRTQSGESSLITWEELTLLAYGFKGFRCAFYR